LFAYQLWTANFLQQLRQQADQIVRRDVTPGFIVAELIAYLNEHKIVRPGYTTLQTLISESLSAERQRLESLLAGVLDEAAKNALAQLLVRDDTLSELAALKQDAKDFGCRQMAREREKRAKLELLYRIAKALLAQARDLTAESSLLRGSGYLLHRLRPAPPQVRAGSFVPPVLRLAALSPTHRQSCRRFGLPHEAVRGRESGEDQQVFRCGAGATAAGKAIKQKLFAIAFE
jgi:hypothetical protein